MFKFINRSIILRIQSQKKQDEIEKIIYKNKSELFKYTWRLRRKKKGK